MTNPEPPPAELRDLLIRAGWWNLDRAIDWYLDDHGCYHVLMSPLVLEGEAGQDHEVMLRPQPGAPTAEDISAARRRGLAGRTPLTGPSD